MSESTAARKARQRHRDHLRRSAVSDITPGQELAMRLKARTCPLCGIAMTSKLGQPNSKHLDHVVPLAIGGTHTHGNVRIVCRTCNLKRPKDGSDYSGPVTLWAQGPVPVRRPHGMTVRAAGRKTCGKGLHPWTPENILVTGSGKKLCRACYLEKEKHHTHKGAILKECKCGAPFAAAGKTAMCPDCIVATARRAASLHASGMTWKQVAAEVGYESGTGAWYAAKRIGYVPASRPVVVKSQPACPDCGSPFTAKGRQSCCEACATAKAWRAVELRFGQGRTLRYIAGVLGFDSVTSVTNLMKTVVTIESRMGRPRDL
jgi:hypothetical protein